MNSEWWLVWGWLMGVLAYPCLKSIFDYIRIDVEERAIFEDEIVKAHKISDRRIRELRKKKIIQKTKKVV